MGIIREETKDSFFGLTLLVISSIYGEQILELNDPGLLWQKCLEIGRK